MFSTKIVLLIGIGIVMVVGSTMALRCRTDDGPSMEDIKKVVRTCMNKHDSSKNRSNKYNHNEYDDDSDSSESDEDDDQNHDDNNRRNSGNQYPYNGDNRGNGHDTRFGYDNRNQGGQNQRQYLVPIRGRMVLKQVSAYSNDNQQQQRSHDGSFGNNGKGEGDNNNATARLKNSDSNSCMVLCFFAEMKMTNRDGYPDKHKMLNVMTHDLRDMQLKDFYVDTIQECHRILEMEQSRDKCAFARHIVTCLSERARANCEDFQESMLF